MGNQRLLPSPGRARARQFLRLFGALLAALALGCEASPPRRLPEGLAADLSAPSRPQARAARGEAPAALERSAPAEHLYAGSPRPTRPESTFTELENSGYLVGYSEARKDPLWAAYRLFALDDPQTLPRPSRFKLDARTQARVRHEDYTGSGYDRGHLAPNFAIASRYGRAAQLETFLMSNICPQCPGLNQETWEAFEKLEANEYADDFEEIWVITGPIFTDDNALPSGIAIPSQFYKIVVDEEGSRPSILALIMTQQTHGRAPLRQFLTTVDRIEELTGLDFFAELPDELESKLEASPADPHWGLERELIPSRAPRPRPPCGE
jgi:endonuclease G